MIEPTLGNGLMCSGGSLGSLSSPGKRAVLHAMVSEKFLNV